MCGDLVIIFGWLVGLIFGDEEYWFFFQGLIVIDYISIDMCSCVFM